MEVMDWLHGIEGLEHDAGEVGWLGSEAVEV